MGGGPVEIMVIAEESGRALVIEPFVDTVVVVAGGLLDRAGNPAAEAVLEQIAADKVHRGGIPGSVVHQRCSRWRALGPHRLPGGRDETHRSPLIS